MRIITITSDWGYRDYYTAAFKGSVLSQYPECKIVDITHEISPFMINEASFVLRHSYKSFPKGTIHIIGINSDASNKTPHTAVFYDGHYFIGADNGVFSLICDEKPDKIVELNIIQDSNYFTFSSKDVFAKAACIIAKGGNIEELGELQDSINEMIYPKAVIEKDLIKGTVIHIDRYNNLITNISQPKFNEIKKGRAFEINLPANYKITEINTSYDDVEPGEIVALFGTSSLLEIAINKGNASGLLGIYINNIIRIDFGSEFKLTI